MERNRLGRESPGTVHRGMVVFRGCFQGTSQRLQIPAPPVEVSSSGSAPVVGLGGCILIRLVEERVETRVGRPAVSSLSEELAELMAQS